MPILWLTAAACALVLAKDRSFRRAEVRSLIDRAEAARILRQFVVVAVLLALLVYSFAPELFLRLPRRLPLLWGAVMLLYPPLSVLPQGIVYRSFFFHRYRPLFNTPAKRIFFSALFFAFMHITFHNVYAVALTFAGGLLFAYTHERTRSLFASSVEHSLYGMLVITVGLGVFILRGTQQLACSMAGLCGPEYQIIEGR